ncbi:uncharacterized protein LOC123506904 isoform X3 [Portunus trituberculatus]|uniref:uncharacterized protein LOC123506904 isoform X3 n=1 Tax=Portunus trituberculatus TaxID=210409 RepID=UPI001E1CB2E1|nr:uncharacterized protein LOC123506904 isoform X3 [Portunus trituberculatus]
MKANTFCKASVGTFFKQGSMKECLRVAVAAVAALGIIYLLYQYLAAPRAFTVVHPPVLHVLREEYSVWPPFIGRLPHSQHYIVPSPSSCLLQEWYTSECFDSRTSEDLVEIFGSLIPTWAESPHLECQESYSRFQELYEVHQRTSGPLEMPSSFAEKVRGWLGGDEMFREKVDKQMIIHVFHPLMSEHTVYNPVRAQRPMPDTGQDIFDWVSERVAKTKATCDFCRFNTQTAADKFGRHETKDTVRISNTFKMEAHHSMVVPSHVHHPLHLPRDLLVHLFEDATQWFFDVGQQEPHFIYPNLAWDTLFHAGASQIHPHIHMMLAPDHYYGSMEGLRTAAQAYYRSTGRNYFSSLVTIHDTLGLAVEYGDAVALSSLGGKGDLEVVFLCDYPSKDFFSLIYFTVQAYHDTFRQPCKSLAGAWPALGTTRNASVGRLPAIARMVSRGDCSSLRADFSTFEIFQAVYRPHTPWQVAAAIRKAIEKYDK